jgi:hypothetical protein
MRGHRRDYAKSFGVPLYAEKLDIHLPKLDEVGEKSGEKYKKVGNFEI